MDRVQALAKSAGQMAAHVSKKVGDMAASKSKPAEDQTPNTVKTDKHQKPKKKKSKDWKSTAKGVFNDARAGIEKLTHSFNQGFDEASTAGKPSSNGQAKAKSGDCQGGKTAVAATQTQQGADEVAGSTSDGRHHTARVEAATEAAEAGASAPLHRK
jgi:hypothetical protein